MLPTCCTKTSQNPAAGIVVHISYAHGFKIFQWRAVEQSDEMSRVKKWRMLDIVIPTDPSRFSAGLGFLGNSSIVFEARCIDKRTEGVHFERCYWHLLRAKKELEYKLDAFIILASKLS